MSEFDRVFTDAVKDVIGNDPVLDQFDISYNASFYGTLQDDYVTGSLLSVSRGTRGETILTQGSRGKVFSKYFADTQSPLSSVYASGDVALIPQLSYRQVPWSDRVSKVFNRNMQCFDSNERYYDSCLPDLKECFQANQSRPWKLNSQASLSPYGNVDISSNAFMIFNTIPLERSNEGYSNDPTVNNEWTWSYPYEQKYKPQKRLIKTTDSLGINTVDLTVDWDFELSSSYFNNWNISIHNLTELENDKLSLINGIIPILPGNLEGASIRPIGGRNSLRGVFSGSYPYGTKGLYGVDSSLDDKLGVSLLVPSDVNLGRYADHTFLGGLSVTDPGNELLTGSMTLDDTVKFFFGFGDLNNMTYSRYDYTASSESYEEDFEIGENITYYMWGASNTADSTQINSGYDRALDRVKESSTYTISRDNGPVEFRLTGWHSVAYDNIADTYWISDNSDPNRTSIPTGTWTVRFNCYGSNSELQVKAKIYKLNGSTATEIGETEVKSVPLSMTYMSLAWTISGSPITLVSSDRIAVKLLVNFPTGAATVYFKNRHTYGTVITRYSAVYTNMPSTYDPNAKYTASYSLTSYNQNGLSVDWGKSPTTKPWNIVYRSGSTTIGSTDYNFWGPGPLSGTYATNKRGLFGPTNTNNDFILYSSGSYDVSSQEYSICCMDITSSYPWSLSYDRAVAGQEDLYFISYISGYPGKPSHQLAGGAFEIIETLETVTGSNNDPGTTPPPPKYYHDYFSNFNSALQYGGTLSSPNTFPPGEWRVNFKLDWDSISSANEFIMAGLDNIVLTTYSVDGDPNGPKIGGNNYPHFRTYRVDPRVNETITGGTTTNSLATKSLHEANIFGISPVIRGWKYGLYSGLPMNSKAVFRRNRYGQFRDMLEQRQYTKFINVEDTPVNDDAVVRNNFSKFTQSRLIRTITTNTVGPSVAEVNFFRQRYKKDDRGIGFIYNESVGPELTTSQNLSTEVTSSVPYFDGVAKTRQESDLSLITDAILTSLQIDTTGLTVT